MILYKSLSLLFHLNSHSFKCKTNLSSLNPLNFASLLLENDQNNSIPLTWFYHEQTHYENDKYDSDHSRLE